MSRKTLILFGLLSLPSPCLADMRCPEKGLIVDEGMTQYEVISRCGEPNFKTIIEQPEQTVAVAENRGPGGTAAVVVTSNPPIEEWTYDFGPNRLLYLLRFRNGRLTKISTEGYGTKR